MERSEDKRSLFLKRLSIPSVLGSAPSINPAPVGAVRAPASGPASVGSSVASSPAEKKSRLDEFAASITDDLMSFASGILPSVVDRTSLGERSGGSVSTTASLVGSTGAVGAASALSSPVGSTAPAAMDDDLLTSPASSKGSGGSSDSYLARRKKLKEEARIYIDVEEEEIAPTPVEEDPVAEVEHKQEKKVASSFSFLAKRFVLSKSSSTQFGRTWLKSALGPHGTSLLDTVIQVCRHHSGEKLAFEFQKHLIKIATKLKLAMDEGLLSKDESLKCEIVMVGTGKQLLICLEKKEPVDYDKLITYLNEVKIQLLSLAGGVFSQSNIDRVNEIMSYFANRDFLETFLFDKDLDSYRGEFTTSLRKMLNYLVCQKIKSDRFVRSRALTPSHGSETTETMPDHESSERESCKVSSM